jgi:catechol 2,3-dioxygenase-like lactoylglutathione lyase family enzyme
MAGMLLDGINHVAVLTADTDRLIAFYGDVFEATVDGEMRETDGFRLTLLKVGSYSELNVFEIDGNDEASRQVPMFGRGRLDHLALQAASLDAFDTIRDRPTSGRCSASSSATRTGSRPRCASPTPMPSPVSSTRPARRRAVTTLSHEPSRPGTSALTGRPRTTERRSSRPPRTSALIGRPPTTQRRSSGVRSRGRHRRRRGSSCR